jgi:hypothetical protein
MIKVLSEYLYTQIVEIDTPIHQIASSIFEMSADYKNKGFALGILSFYGLELQKGASLF